ncbi:hypothetical protein IW261DRAFT_1428227 [Armillaria novae-zelandiae]|uniref:Uncharacterized protein n=1 Tax=Armillaria novae-zelandiae TaxID=153914 RepID=A0AA39NAP1_9AGAR|nr:hypothetical protein IW261DRAFT_1428227 [Armillaria novae-zelandiae]
MSRSFDGWITTWHTIQGQCPEPYAHAPGHPLPEPPIVPSDDHLYVSGISFEKAHYAHHMAHGLSEDDDVFLVSLEPRLWISPNGTIIPDWEVPTDKTGKEMADEDLHWGSNNGKEAEGATDEQISGSLVIPLPLTSGDG